jgi:hypothetical protein
MVRSNPQTTVSNYKIAKAALLESARSYINSDTDPFRHNLNVALYQFVEAVEADIREVRSCLSRIESLQQSHGADGPQNILQDSLTASSDPRTSEKK